MNSPVVGDAPVYGFQPCQDPSGSDDPFPESAVPKNGKVGNQVLCPHARCFGSYFDVIFFAPPAERQRSFSNVELSVKIWGGGEGVNLRKASVKFFSFLAWSFFGMT